MTFESLLADLQKRKYEPVYLLQGEETYFIDVLTRHFEEKILTPEQKAFNYSVYYGKDTSPDELIAKLQHYPLGAEKQVVILKEAQMMNGLNNLDKYISQPVPSSILVICHKHKTVDGRTAFAKNIKKNGVVFTSKKLYENKIPRWIMNYTNSHGYRINEKEAAIVAEHLGNDISKIVNELDKLFINVEQGKRITGNHIHNHIGISKEYNVFELQRALGTGNDSLAFTIVDYFHRNPKDNPPIMVVASLASYFSKIFIMQELVRHSDKEIQAALGLSSSYFVREYKDAARNYNRSNTRRVISYLKEYDLKIKGIDRVSMSEKALLMELVYKIAGQRNKVMEYDT